MSTIVAGICASHATQMNTAWDRTKDRASGQRFIDGLGEARRIIEAAEPDVLVVVGANHFQGVHLDMIPAFAVGVGEVDGAGESGTPGGPLPVDTELARTLAWGLIDRDFDIGISLRLTVDHGITIGMQYLTPELDLPIVPIVVNSFTPPLPTMRRCRALGQAVRDVIESDGADRRVAIMASGGLSHHLPFFPKWWEAETEQDQFLVEAMFPRDEETDQKYAQARGSIMKEASSHVNPEFDEEILQMVTERDWDRILSLSDDEIYERGGNGAQEIRSWVFAAAAVEGTGSKIVYSPMHEWHTGMAVATLRS